MAKVGIRILGVSGMRLLISVAYGFVGTGTGYLAAVVAAVISGTEITRWLAISQPVERLVVALTCLVILSVADLHWSARGLHPFHIYVELAAFLLGVFTYMSYVMITF